MARKTAAELQLKPEKIEGAPAPDNMDEMPDEFSSAPPPPYPGSYRWTPPKNFAALWDKFEATIKDRDGNILSDKAGKKLEKVERIILVFDKDDPLVIKQAPAGHEHLIGQPFTCQIRNNERDRSRKGEPPVYIDDLTYLLRAWGETVRPTTNLGFIEAANKHAGQEFGSDLEWTGSCNPQREAYFDVFTDAQGQQQWAPEYVEPGTVVSSVQVKDAAGAPRKGCGKRYYMNDWKKDRSGVYLPRHRCACGASLRPFGQLRNFRA